MPIQIIPISSGNFSQVVRKHGPDMPSPDTLLLEQQNRKNKKQVYGVCSIDTPISRTECGETLPAMYRF